VYIHAFNIIYWAQIEKGVVRSLLLERDIEIKAILISEDDRRNLQDLYCELFGAEGEQFIISLVDRYMQRLSETTLANADDIVSILDLLQSVIMTAKAQYGIPVNSDLYAFAQRYDRLDDDTVRLSLFKEAKERNKKI
jgi:hypothetical protein